MGPEIWELEVGEKPDDATAPLAAAAAASPLRSEILKIAGGVGRIFCFQKYTPIQLESTFTKYISDIKIGDKLALKVYKELTKHTALITKKIVSQS